MDACTRGEFEGMSMHIVAVCTGNVCRSPQVEQLLRRAVEGLPSAAVSVASAGTLAQPGEPMHPLAADWSRHLGGDPGAHRATYLTPRVLRGAGLVLGLAREHRRAVVSMDPSLTKVTFTLREFARLAEDRSTEEMVSAADLADETADGRLASVLALLAQGRGLRPGLHDPVEDDVLDPIGREPAAFERSALEVRGALQHVVRVLQVAAGSWAGGSALPVPTR